MAASNDLECLVCLEENMVFRVLNCNHFFCEQCCEKLKCIDNNNVSSITCPIDRQCTEVSAGLSSLPIKLLAKIECQSCSKSTCLKEHFWCTDCNEAVCSYCFMKLHKKHDYTDVDDGSILTQCRAALQPSSNRFAEAQQICQSLTFELENRLAHGKNANSFVKAIEVIMGAEQSWCNEKNSIGQVDNKKLLFATKIIKAMSNESFDADELKDSIQEPSHEFRIPSVSEVIDLFFVPKKSESTAARGIRAGPSSLTEDKDISTQQPESEAKVSDSGLRLRCKNSLWFPLSVFAICAIPSPNEGVLVVCTDGIHKYDKKLNFICSILFPPNHSLRKANIEAYVCGAYHERRGTFLMTIRIKGIVGYLEEYKVLSTHIDFWSSVKYQGQVGDCLATSCFSPLLMSILNDDTVLLAQGDNKTSAFLAKYELIDQKVLQFWPTKKREFYDDMAVEGSFESEVHENIFVIGRTKILMFQIDHSSNRFSHFKTISNCHVLPPFITVCSRIMMFMCAKPNELEPVVDLFCKKRSNLAACKVFVDEMELDWLFSSAENNVYCFNLKRNTIQIYE